MFKNSKKYILYLLPLLSFGMLIILLNLTSPLEVGPIGILLMFSLLYLCLVGGLYGLASVTSLLVGRLTQTKQLLKKRKLYYMTSVVALGPVFLLALNSIGQLDLKDFLFVLLLIIVTCFYISRRL